ncbi:MAG: alcohol dehydrogenase catalytic domain-containing protein [Thermodesulfobacteriota bacterium]|nr:alcohol dehydrogenase catalytic domain-containing protein [Thermodesulfobacteriota bacterium]
MKAIMKATQEAGSLEVKELPTPKPGPGEILVQMKAAGICYSDVMILTNKYKGRVPVPIPMIMGHEGAGVIAEVGEGVEHVKGGDKVGLNPLWGCGQCQSCLNGYPNMCMTWRHLGITCDGTFAEYRVLPAFVAYRLPENISMIDAAFLEPISLTVRTLDHVKPRLGDTVAIIGPGSIGMFHLQAFKSAGASITIVIGLDQDAKRFEIAKKLGADHIVNGSKEDVAKRVRELTNGQGVDIVVETANHPSTVPLAINLAAARGRIVLFGLYPEATLSPLTMLRSGLTVMGDVAVLPSQFLRAIRWVEYKKVLAEPMVSRKFRLDQAKEAFEVFSQGDIVKVLFEM